MGARCCSALVSAPAASKIKDMAAAVCAPEISQLSSHGGGTGFHDCPSAAGCLCELMWRLTTLLINVFLEAAVVGKGVKLGCTLQSGQLHLFWDVREHGR